MLDKSFNCFRCNFSRVCELSRIQKKFWSNDLHIEERGVNGRRGGGGGFCKMLLRVRNISSLFRLGLVSENLGFKLLCFSEYYL